ncbi:gliding motility-associated C-terminal domain-containing protein [Mucilaginibacter terrigena]|uniref:Gliding motility-associated C-terminal domain-containing protein n=1 Tax=Mucilaginibacter terrigena TaxID=2492395 RepID=A0A4Q5LPU0_9SPHI|nr:gliding motility-associated C-terminal domain-containing protein [Mucilaginibacter terrigena]RYU91412.1 gliding motility-associated C-terminal domain-containing protein [Mucilaginibacter terrigena]
MAQKFGSFILLFILLTFAGLPSFGQVNIDFEKGNFDNWEFAIGKIDTLGTVSLRPSYAIPGSFTILKNDGLEIKDEFGDFPRFSPNGSKYSVKLGNTAVGNDVQQMSYTMTVPPSGSNSIIFDYAVVLVNPGHNASQQPRFTVKIYNITDNNYLECPSFDFISSSDLPGFKYNSDGVFYKDWSSATINLTGLNNKKIRLEFTVNHCSFGEHFGYAYFDISENIGAPVSGNIFCDNQMGITLSAPPGFATYTWYSADMLSTLGTGRILTLPLPATNTNIAVKVTPFNGLGCTDILYTTLNGINGEFKFVAKQELVGCPGSAADLTAAEITQGSSPGLTFQYLTESFEPLPLPAQITRAGIYYIRATNAGGCSNLLPVKLSFNQPALVTANPLPVTYPATINLTTYFTPKQDLIYSYYQDAIATMPLNNYTAVTTSGIYYIKAETASGCQNIQPVTVTILPPPPYSVTAPNLFSPNNDGINDTFHISLSGYITFSSLRIYNRNGKQVMQTMDPGLYWDGKHNGQPLPTGTYYWIMEGVDDYYHNKVTRSSFITLLK